MKKNRHCPVITTKYSLAGLREQSRSISSEIYATD